MRKIMLKTNCAIKRMEKKLSQNGPVILFHLLVRNVGFIEKFAFFAVGLQIILVKQKVTTIRHDAIPDVAILEPQLMGRASHRTNLVAPVVCETVQRRVIQDTNDGAAIVRIVNLLIRGIKHIEKVARIRVNHCKTPYSSKFFIP